MPIALPFLCFFLLTAFFKRKSGASWREAVILSFVSCGVLIFLSTEILSLFQAFHFKSLCAVWGLAVAAAAGLNVWCRGNSSWDLPDIRSFTLREKALLVFIVLESAVLAALAFGLPPATWDGMTYHMSRVAHWVQNQTVAYYPTNIVRQLFVNPFAEYWIAHFQILSKGDYFANGVQWLSMVGSLVGISLIAKELGHGRLGQILSAFLVVTLPMAVIEASSTQNDFVATLWTVITVYYMLKNAHELTLKNTILCALAGALAFYTKGSTIFILVPFLIWLALDGMRNTRTNPWRAARHLSVIILALSLSIGLILWKNQSAMGSTVFPGEKSHIFALHEIKGMTSNLVLHYAMHFRFGILQLDGPVAALVEKIHQAMGTTTLTSPANMGGLPLNYVDFPFYEDEIPNLIFSVFFLFALVGFIRRHEYRGLTGRFFLMTFLCLFIFNALIKWSPYDCRYHLPFFVLLAPFLAGALARWSKGLAPVLILFGVLTIPFIFFNSSKPFVSGPIHLFYKKEPVYGGTSILKTSRDFQYFYNHSGIGLSFFLTAKAVAESGCKQVGLRFGEDTWEYPFWAYLNKGGAPIRMEHVMVENASGKIPYPAGDFLPCVIVSDLPLEVLYFDGKFYPKVASTADFHLFFSTDFLAEKSR
jgi:hypothetical protein